MYDDLIKLFPGSLRYLFLKVAESRKEIQEIRIRAWRPVIVIRNGKEYFLKEDGDYTTKAEEAQCLSERDTEEIFQHICNYSVYAYEDEIRQGYITVAGGHRVGVAGQVVLEDDLHIRTIKHIRYLNIRISHEVRGASESVLPYIYRNGKLYNTLIVSPPGCGKTTMLRDMIREISDGNSFGRGQTVGVVDERSELAGCYMGIAQNDLGIRTDILDGCPKALGMIQLIRAMAPEVIAVDELGDEEDIRAVQKALCCGCSMIATIHAENQEELEKKDYLKPLYQKRAFQRYIYMKKEDGKCIVEGIYDAEGVKIW